MAVLRRFILQKESAAGQKMNILKHPHEIAVSPQSVWQGEQSRAAGLCCRWHWLELCRLGEWKGPLGHGADGARRCTGLGEAVVLSAKGSAADG